MCFSSLRRRKTGLCGCVVTDRHGHAPASAPAAFEDCFQNQRLVVFLIPRAVHQSDSVILALLLQQLESVLLLSELLPVTDLELTPFGRVVIEPLTQLRARSHLLQPEFHRRALFGQTARPQAIDQYSHAVFSRRLFVNSLQLDHCVPLRSWTGASNSRTFRQTFSTVKPYSCITTSPGAELP